MKASIATMILAAAAIVGLAAAPPEAGWKKVEARRGGCAIYVPPDWVVNPTLKGMANSADKSTTLAVSLAPNATLATAKAINESAFKPTKTFEDSAKRLFYQYEPNGKTGYYVGVPVSGGVCGAQVTFKSGQDAVARKIAESIGPS